MVVRLYQRIQLLLELKFRDGPVHQFFQTDLLIGQGQEMGRGGHVRVWACRREGQIRVQLAGRAVAGQPFTLQLP